mmetsp:Transcript_5521/g.6378  ORF Transcript_5521/g.6378 Transcript_5521/m.6378 type:complete len:129 (-) Transcript_5521:79-465(-)
MTASRLLNQLQLLLLLVSCWPTVAFSSSTPLFVSRHSRSTNNNIQSLKHNVKSGESSSQLYLSIPQGGNQSEAKPAAVATLGLLSPIATVLQSAGSTRGSSCSHQIPHSGVDILPLGLLCTKYWKAKQ